MVSYRVDNMTCGGCAGRINRALKQLDDGAEVEISVSERLVRVRSNEATETELAAAIREAGYTPVKVADAAPAASRGRSGGGGACS
jgi:copper chaperone